MIESSKYNRENNQENTFEHKKNKTRLNLTLG